MANWGKISSRGSVSDRRGISSGFGGVSLVMVALVIGFNLFSSGGDVDINQVLEQLSSVQTNTSTTSVQPEQFKGEDSYEVFASTVLGSTNDVWSSVFSGSGKTYRTPELVLFRDAVATGCGTATSQVGPFYCPEDSTIYLDETFFAELENRFGAEGGDVAEAYVIAHEVGHHVQNELGLLEGRQTNEESVKTELQADCFAGVWAFSLRDANVFEPGEFDEAIDAAAAVGDDRIQEAIEGRVDPESWTHGSSEDRKYWLGVGFESGDPARCNTL